MSAVGTDYDQIERRSRHCEEAVKPRWILIYNAGMNVHQCDGDTAFAGGASMYNHTTSFLDHPPYLCGQMVSVVQTRRDQNRHVLGEG